MEQLNNLPPFYVGQKVEVVLNGNTSDTFKNGEQFKVKAIKKNTCCGVWVVDVGRYLSSIDTFTCFCSRKYSYDGFYAAMIFRPLQEQNFPLISYSKVLEEEKQFVSCN